MKQPLISVIIPVYNKEAYIVDCLTSVAHQTYKNIEMIIVDDGSTDCSGLLISEFLQRSDIRANVITQKNGGPSKARNAGIKSAQGEYTLFLDADDMLTQDCIAVCVNLAQKNDVDMVEFAFTEDPYGERGSGEILLMENRLLVLREMLAKGKIKPLAWGALYKTERMQRVTFIETLKWGEDCCFKLDYVMAAQAALYVDRTLYVNRILTDNTLSRQRTSRAMVKSNVAFMCHYESRLNDITDPTCTNLLKQSIYVSAVSNLGRVIRDGMENECREEVLGLARICDKYKKTASVKNLKYTLSYFLMRMNKGWYLFLYSLLKKETSTI